MVKEEAETKDEEVKEKTRTYCVGRKIGIAHARGQAACVDGENTEIGTWNR